jgi:CheY-like chemotaxis protein
VPARLRGDPSRLRQVISNLLSNAVKFTEQGEIVLTIALVRQDAAKVLLEFQMRDTGIGIDRAGQARLFEAFSQADGSMARKYGGTGLGLAISKRLVELMQGAIHVDSVPGKGSVFTFTAEFEQAQQEAAASAQLEDWRALVVSDNPTSRFLLGELFSDRQAGWRLAWNFEMAHALIEEAKDSTFDAAIVDLPCTADEVRQLAETIGTTGRCQARVIVLTLPGQRIEGLDEIPGVQALSKPIKQRRLLGLVETVAPAEAPAETERTTTAERGLRILLAEDNTINQKVACGILRNLGHSADIAINGEQVLAALADAAYDVIFMDCQMPVMDGFEATRRVRAMQIAQPKIIAMTANALPGDRERCLACGMDDYITKPIRPEMLREKLAGVR